MHAAASKTCRRIPTIPNISLILGLMFVFFTACNDEDKYINYAKSIDHWNS